MSLTILSCSSSALDFRSTVGIEAICGAVLVDFVLLNTGVVLSGAGSGFDATGDGLEVYGGGLDAVTPVGAVLGDSKMEKSAFAQGSPERGVNLDRSPRLDLLAGFGTKRSVLKGLLDMEPLLGFPSE